MKFERLSDQLSPVSEHTSKDRENKTFLKQALLLTTAIFLMTAPTPDSHDIVEITANFIKAASPSHPSALKAS